MVERAVGATPAVTVPSLRLGNNGPEIGALPAVGATVAVLLEGRTSGTRGWTPELERGLPRRASEKMRTSILLPQGTETCQQLRSSLETAAPADTLISTQETASRGPANLCPEAMR